MYTRNEKTSYFTLSSSANFKLNKTNVEKYLTKQRRLNYNSLEELFQIEYSLWEIDVAVDIDQLNWIKRKLVCNCPYYSKNYVCKHTLALAVQLKLVTIPLNAKSLNIGEKAKRGRPAKAKQALLTQ